MTTGPENEVSCSQGRDGTSSEPGVTTFSRRLKLRMVACSDRYGQASATQFEALQYYGLRALSVQSDALAVDQRLQDQFNPCQIATLVVEAPVLTYLAKAYAFDQVP